MTEPQALQEALELAKWQGRMEERVDGHEDRLRAVNGSIARNAEAMQDLRNEVSKIGVRVGLGSTIGGGFLAIAVGVGVYVLTH